MKSAALALLLAAVAALPSGSAAAPTGDPTHGEEIYARCVACHSLAYDRTGPRHCGLFGRRAGSVPGFGYSPAMARAAIVWNEKTLERFVASPATVVPGTAMGYAGIADPQERADLIAWLRLASRSAERCTP